MALKHFWLRRRLRARDRMRRRIERYHVQNANLRRESIAGLYRRKLITLLVLVLSILGCGLLVFPTIAREPSGIPGGTLDMFNANDIPYWDPCAGGSSGGGGGDSDGGTAGEVEGDDNKAKIWNWFVNAGLNGVSDDAKVIAGIMGNFEQESTFNPYAFSGTYYGLFQAGPDYPDFPSYVEQRAGGSYWGGQAPPEVNDKAIVAELEYLTTKTQRWGWFVDNLGVVTNKTPSSYAELFLSAFEGATGGDPIQDPGVVSYAQGTFGTSSYQETTQRRNFAEATYEQYGKSGAKTTTGSSSASGGSNDGSNVLIIGDSMTEASKSELQKLMPKADIDSKSGRTFQEGLDILNLKSNPRDIIVFALGSNSPSITKKKAEEVISKAGDKRKVIFVTNYSLGRINYTNNNKIFNDLAKEHSNVSVADWAGAVSSDSSKYVRRDPDGVDVHPTDGDGTKLFAETIYDAVKSVSKSSTNKSQSSSSEYRDSSGKFIGTGNYDKIMDAKNAEKDSTDFEPPGATFSDTDNGSMKTLLENYGDLAYQLGRVVAAPLQAILVQMRYEDPHSICGRNNFWGNGCPAGTPPGGASIQGENLGQGFQQYGKTLTNGMHDQALGEPDPKRYLEKIGPTWVQGDPNGPGYGTIDGMKNSVDALQAFIDSDEGQAIVEGFTNYEGDYMSNGSAPANSDENNLCIDGGGGGGGGSLATNPGEAAGIPEGDRINWLFPNGMPQDQGGMQAYLSTSDIPIVNESGQKTTMKLTAHKKLQAEFIAIFEDLMAAEYKIKPPTTAAFVWKMLPSGGLSVHAYGAAIDVNWQDNWYYDGGCAAIQTGGYQACAFGGGGFEYRPGTNEYSVDAKIVNLWEDHGFHWGAYFSNIFDPMHFSYTEVGAWEPSDGRTK